MTSGMRMALAITGVGALALLAGCSGGDSDDGDGGDFAKKSGADIAAAAKADMADLESMRVAGEITADEQAVSLDLQVASGGTCTGTMGIGDGNVELLGVDGDTWMKPDEAFWRLSSGDTADQIMAIVGDKWVVLPADDDSFGQFCDLDQLLDEMLDDDDDTDTTYTVKGTDEVDGEDVVTVESTNDDGTSLGYVRVDSPHRLLKIERSAGDQTGSVTFADFDDDVDAAAPSDDEVIDLNSLSGS